MRRLFFDRAVSAMDVVAMVDSELTVYGAVGAVFVFLFLALFLGLVFHGPCQSLDKYPHQPSGGDNLRSDHQVQILTRPSHMSPRRC